MTMDRVKTFLKIAAVAVGAASVCAAVGVGVRMHRILTCELHLPEGFTYTAHSGCEDTPENSIAFLEKAVELGVPVLEVDVSVRGDGTPVLMHAELAGDEEGVPLETALQYIAGASNTVQVNLDLKAFSDLAEVQRLVEKYAMQSRCFFTGVDSDHTQTVKIDAPKIPYYLNADLNKHKLKDKAYLQSVVEEVRRCGAVGINCHYDNASEELVEAFHEAGLKVSFWTADKKLVMRELLAMSPDNITTKRPVLLASLLERASESGETA